MISTVKYVSCIGAQTKFDMADDIYIVYISMYTFIVAVWEAPSEHLPLTTALAMAVLT